MPENHLRLRLSQVLSYSHIKSKETRMENSQHITIAVDSQQVPIHFDPLNLAHQKVLFVRRLHLNWDCSLLRKITRNLSVDEGGRCICLHFISQLSATNDACMTDARSNEDSRNGGGYSSSGWAVKYSTLLYVLLWHPG